MKLTKGDLIALEKAVSKKSLSAYAKRVWPIFEPGEPYEHGWHIDAISEHLQALPTGEITRLLINVPPGTMKSTLLGVLFPSWLWGPGGLPHYRFIGAAHEQGLATRDNRRTRLIVESDWFQERWPLKLTGDQNEKTYFENEKRGFRQSTAVASMTGKRGHVVSWDDPINPESANSPVALETARRIFTETLTSRLVSPKKSAIVITMQRLNVDDVSGYILASDLGYEHLCLPMEYDSARKCRTKLFQDPRTVEGELLFPKRFPQEVVDRDKRVMGTFATAGQFQQLPVPRGGGMFKREHFAIINALPPMVRWVRGWDLAASKEATSAFTAGILMGKTATGEFVIADAKRGQLTAGDVERLIKNTSAQDAVAYPGVFGSVPQDPGAGGKAFAQSLVKAAAGSSVRASPESGDKITRAQPFAAQVEIGNVSLLAGAWNKDFLDEICTFPNAKIKDQVDAASRAFMELNKTASFEWYAGGETHK